MARILIVDDEPEMLDAISNLCRDRGHQPLPFTSFNAALEALSKVTPHLVLIDVNRDTDAGLAFLRECRMKLAQSAVVMITAYTSVQMAVEAMKLGAYDYITKPFKLDELQFCIQRALEYQAAFRKNDLLKREFRDQYKFENLLGTSAKMQEIYRLIGKVADTESTVLIQGESGTGKELVARALHFNSSRQHHPFLAINCSALPDNALESELFGHKKGAFTGAVADKTGLFEEADHGTIFLDEVNSMPQQIQTKLLRVLQDRQIRRMGDSRQIPINVRTIAASNEQLKSKSKAGGFREDLYYRLAVIPIDIPPLRERLEDVPLLVNYFLQKYAAHTGTERKEIDPRAMERLISYGWPGNVRELENAIERACALSENGRIRLQDLPPHILHESGPAVMSPEVEWQVGQHLDDFVRNQERKYIEMTLKFNQGSREKTASMLGISIATLYRKLDLKHHRDPKV
jgi:two-component system, NtrC family, response regulator PilR